VAQCSRRSAKPEVLNAIFLTKLFRGERLSRFQTRSRPVQPLKSEPSHLLDSVHEVECAPCPPWRRSTRIGATGADGGRDRGFRGTPDDP